MINRIFTPPYLSNEPEVRHVNLAEIKTSTKSDIVLILCSDGLLDLFEARDEPDLKRVSQRWMELGSIPNSENTYDNGALRILREGLGGEDEDKIAQLLTVEISNKWLDDITTLVYKLQ